MNRRGLTVERKCKQCSKNFKALKSKVKKGYGLFCSRKCYDNYRKQNSLDTKHQNRMYQKKHKYGLSEEQYLDMFKQQNNSCAICKTSFKKTKACVDHNHITGIVRGLLCNNCNKALGLVHDNKSILKNMIVYLDNEPDVSS